MSTVEALVADLEKRGVRLRADDGQLVVDAPRGVLTEALKGELRARKLEVLAAVISRSPLLHAAAARAPSIRFTIRESGDAERDFGLVGQIRKCIEEFQPGGNRIRLRIVTPEGRGVVVEWRALADRDLRRSIARLLAEDGLRSQPTA